jgi:uncharacterized protein (TIGR02246 family)
LRNRRNPLNRTEFLADAARLWARRVGRRAQAPSPPDEKSVRATAEAFTDAFNRGNAKEVAALWTPDGSLMDESGKLFKGHAAIDAAYAAFFKAHPGAKIEIAIKAVEFVSPTVAVEDGVARVDSDEAAPPTATRYNVVHTASGGKWLMASVRESSVAVPSNFARVEDLKWLIGKWEATADNATFTSNFRWIANKSFIARDYTTRRDGLVVSAGKQIIGWDAANGHLRSWSFDSTGGYGTGEWSRTPDGWRIHSTGLMADGTPTSSIDQLVRVAGEDRVFGWRSSDRRVAGSQLPNTPEIVFDRAHEKH